MGTKSTWEKCSGKDRMAQFTLESAIKREKKLRLKSLRKKAVRIHLNLVDADEYLKSALFNEIKIMQTLKSDNVVGFFDVMESANNYYIVQ